MKLLIILFDLYVDASSWCGMAPNGKTRVADYIVIFRPFNIERLWWRLQTEIGIGLMPVYILGGGFSPKKNKWNRIDIIIGIQV